MFEHFFIEIQNKTKKSKISSKFNINYTFGLFNFNIMYLFMI